MSKTFPLILGLLAACGAPETHYSVAVEDEVPTYVFVARIPTAEQLALVSALAEQVVEAEQLVFQLQDSAELDGRLGRRRHLRSLIEELERLSSDLERSGALRSEISRISLQADVAVPLDELRLTLEGTRRRKADLPPPD